MQRFLRSRMLTTVTIGQQKSDVCKAMKCVIQMRFTSKDDVIWYIHMITTLSDAFYDSSFFTLIIEVLLEMLSNERRYLKSERKLQRNKYAKIGENAINQ